MKELELGSELEAEVLCTNSAAVPNAMHFSHFRTIKEGPQKLRVYIRW
jgi:hypothetical protein